MLYIKKSTILESETRPSILHGHLWGRIMMLVARYLGEIEEI